MQSIVEAITNNSCTDVSIKPPRILFLPVIQNRFVKESHFTATSNEYSPDEGR